MFQIQNTLVSLDLAEQFFCCDLDACLGACCIEGDAGAPLTEEEAAEIERLVPVIEPDMLPRAIQEVRENGVAYRDPDGELVTTILDGRNCAFSCYGKGGVCLCALEKAYREGRSAGSFRKPASCALYPLRLKEYPTFTAVNYHSWKICAPARKLGREKGIRLYQFLEGPLTERFGAEWYAELKANCELYLREYPDGLS
ncbi:MAG: DUF3109 family protein [[Clostridium] fimetarium]|nr:DUF3109 family protein [Alistipes timonensis]MCM1406542.1 DUF3109 family protein [[Clostridium] fimetarium]